MVQRAVFRSQKTPEKILANLLAQMHLHFVISVLKAFRKRTKKLCFFRRDFVRTRMFQD